MPLDLPEGDLVRRRIPQLYAAFAATMGGATFGMVLGWSAPAIEMLKEADTYTDEELSWVAGIPPLGSLLSMMLMAITLDRFGRKVVMLALVPPFVVGWLLLAFFRSIPVLLVGRFITGFCGAGYCTAAPVYTGEIAEKQIRGALGVFYQLMLTLVDRRHAAAKGQYQGEDGEKVDQAGTDDRTGPNVRPASDWHQHHLLPFENHLHGSRRRNRPYYQLRRHGYHAGVLYVYVVGHWGNLKWLSVCCSFIPVVFFLLFCGAPESPVYLLENDRREEAIRSLRWLRGGREDVSAELAEIDEMVNESHGHVGTLSHKMTTRAALKGLWTEMGLLFFQPLSGQNVIIFYAVSIFVAAGTKTDPNVASIVLAVVQVVATACSAGLVERAGRRILLIFSYTGMGVCLFLVGTFFFLLDHNEPFVKNIRWAPIAIISIYLVVFSLGCGPLSWSMIGEIFPQEIKGICSAICAAANAVMTFIVSKTYMNLERALTTAGTFWLYSVLNFIAAIWIFIFVIETKGKTLEEIQKQLAS